MLVLNFGEILREFGEILGKYRIMDGRSVGSKGLKAMNSNVVVIFFKKRNKKD